MATLLESLSRHRVQHVDEVSPIEDIVLFRPLTNLGVGDKDLWLVAGFGESLLGRDAIPVLVIKPKRKL